MSKGSKPKALPPKASSSSPALDKKDRLPVDTDLPPTPSHFLEALKRYEIPADFDVKSPESWPKELPLKAITTYVAELNISWRNVFKAMFDLEFALLRQSPAPTIPDEPVEFLKPFVFAMWYVLEHAPEKMDQAFQDLLLEARYQTATNRKIYRGLPAEPYSKFANDIAAREKRRVLARMEANGQKPKSKRGQHSKWDTDSFREAMKAAVKSLREDDAQNRKKKKVSNKDLPKITDKDLLKRLAKKLHKDHPAKITNSWDAVRKLIERLDLQPDWEAQKKEWTNNGQPALLDSNPPSILSTKS